MYNLNNEIWKDIKDYPNYMVSNLGNVKSVNYNKTDKEKILKNGKDRGGYLQVNLWKNGNGKKYLIHRLVAEAFIDNPNNLPQIDHINTNKTDNRVCNLRWCTQKENNNNHLTVEKRSKPILQFTKNGEFIRKWKSATDIEREIGIDNSSVSKCCNGKLKSSGGFKWQYAN